MGERTDGRTDERRVTLKDVAKAANVTAGTVHRALANKEGVSEQVRRAIVEQAKQMGYTANSLASSMKRRTMRIAIVLPGVTEENRYFYPAVWRGIRDSAAEVRDYNLETAEYVYEGSFQGQLAVLKAIEELDGPAFDGLVTIAHGGQEIAGYLNRMIRRGTSVVLICDDSAEVNRLCCVRADDFVAGGLAAELLCAALPERSGVLVAAGDADISSHLQSVAGFEAHMRLYAPGKEIVKFHHYENQDDVYRTARELLQKHGDIGGMYSTTARNTLALCKAAEELGRGGQVRIVGNDVFEESAKLLRRGALFALIHKNPYAQAYTGFKTLFDHLFKNRRPARDTIRVESVAVLRSNVDLYV